MYNYDFDGYCYSCNVFGHKAYDCRYNQWRRSAFHARFISSMRNKRSNPLVTYLGHVEWYTFHNFGHMERELFFPVTQAKIDKSSKSKKDLAQNQWRNKRSNQRPFGERRSSNSLSSGENSLLQSMTSSCIFIKDCKVHERCTTLGGAFGSLMSTSYCNTWWVILSIIHIQIHIMNLSLGGILSLGGAMHFMMVA